MPSGNGEAKILFLSQKTNILKASCAFFVCCLINSNAFAQDVAPSQIFIASARPSPKQRADAELAFARAKKNDFEGAALLFDKCLDLSTWTIAALVPAARIYAQAEQLSKSMHLLDEILKKSKSTPSQDPGNIALAWRYKGDCAADMGKIDDAVAAYIQSASLTSVPEAVMLALRPAAHLRRMQKRYPEALALLNKAAPKGTDNIYWRYEHAVVLAELKKPAEAIVDLNLAINELNRRRKASEDKNSHLFREALNLRSKCFSETNQPALAAADRLTLKNLNQSWAEDLFGSAPVK